MNCINCGKRSTNKVCSVCVKEKSVLVNRLKKSRFMGRAFSLKELNRFSLEGLRSVEKKLLGLERYEMYIKRRKHS